MALKATWVDQYADKILVFVLAECPLKPATKCDGTVELGFEYMGENMAIWGKNEDQAAPCDKCGCMLGFNTNMLSEALKEAERVVKLRGYKAPGLTNEPRMKVEVLTDLPSEYLGEEYLILAQVNCQIPRCKGKTVFSCHLVDKVDEGLNFGSTGRQRGCEQCGAVTQLTVAQIVQVVREARRQLTEAEVTTA